MSLPRKHMGVYFKCPVGTEGDKLEGFAARARKIARELQDFWRYESDGKWDVRCEGFAMPSDCDPRPPLMCSHIAKQIDTGDFDPNYWHVVDNVSAGYCGQGMFGGNISVNYLFFSCKQFTTNHELGHNHGLLHDGTRDPEGNEREYGNTSTMGTAIPPTGLSSPHRVLLGFESDREISQVDSTVQVLIAPIEMSKHVLRNDEWQNIRIGSDYSVSLRKQRGTRYPVPKGKERALYIHHIDLRDRGNLKLLTPALHPGKTRKLDNGIEIIYHEFNDETARVTIQYPDQDPPADLEMPHGPPVTLESSRIDESHSGLYFKPEYDGQGFDVAVKNGRLTVYNYAFSQDGESQRYYLGSGEIVDGACVLDLFTTRGGTFNDPASHQAIEIGKAQIFFNDDDTGVYHYNTTEHGRGAVNLTRLATTTPSRFNGSWYLPERVGEGLSINQFSNTLGVYWYTFDGQGNQKWYILTGTPESLTIMEARGGRWLFFDDVETPVIGTASIFINRGGGVTLKYDSPLLGKGERMMVRLF